LVIALFTLVHIVVDTALHLASARVRALSPQARSDFLLQLIWVIGCSPLPLMYAAALPSVYASVDARWHATSRYAEWAMLLHVGSSVYEVGVYVLYGKPWVYTAHHLIAIYAYGVGLYVGAHHFWGAAAGLVEITNINVAVLKMSILLGIGRGGALEALNGAVLYVLYLLVRVLLLPCVLALYLHDAWYFADATWRTPASAPLVCLRATTFPCTLVIWLLSCAWFRPIHRGMLKVLRGADPLEGEDDAIAENVGGGGGAARDYLKEKRT